jgi:hypothetical protein
MEDAFETKYEPSARSHVLGHFDSNPLKNEVAKIAKTSTNFDSIMAFPVSLIQLGIKMVSSGLQ